MSEIELHLAKVPRDKEQQLKLCIEMMRRLTGREPAPKDIEEARKTLGIDP